MAAGAERSGRSSTRRHRRIEAEERFLAKSTAGEHDRVEDSAYEVKGRRPDVSTAAPKRRRRRVLTLALAALVIASLVVVLAAVGSVAVATRSEEHTPE